MKKFIDRMFSIMMIAIIILAMLATFTMPVMASSGSDIVKEAIVSLLSSDIAIAGIVAILLAIMGFAINKNVYVKHVVNLGILAYEYAENEGLVQKLRGYRKFDPFMDKFIKEYKAKYGKDPTPADKGIAVKAMETKVLSEAKK